MEVLQWKQDKFTNRRQKTVKNQSKKKTKRNNSIRINLIAAIGGTVQFEKY